MKLFFLSAVVPLTKTFARLPDGSIEKSPYPMVREFTSYEESVDTPAEFHDVLRQHAAEGHCLLKGNLRRALDNESRAGSTSAQDTTQWLCFDLDGINGFESVAQFITQVLPTNFHNVDYVLQYSASAGITGNAGIRAHIFFLTSSPFPSTVAKHFVTGLNFDCATLKEQLTLTAAGTALKFPLDRTVNQPDKLIYIAPPTLSEGMDDPLGDDRIQLVNGERRFVDFDIASVKTVAQVDALINDQVNDLRQAMGLPRRKPKTERVAGEDILVNPDRATVTGERRARGFVYLNLNGGDSWAYYYNEDKPFLLYNFKGEPVVRLEDIVPDYYASIQAERPAAQEPGRDITNGAHPFCFRRHDNDVIYAGVWDSTDHEFLLPPAPVQKGNLPDFFTEHGGVVPEPINTWVYEFRPYDTTRFSVERRFCNMWTPTKYMHADESWTMPPTIDKILHSVVGNDQACYDHFLNWLACIFQDRIKTGTAWVLHGIPGTGKGVLFHKILVPLFGSQHCVSKTISGLEDRFNADMEHCLIFNLDEARTEDSTTAKRLVNKIKNMITEPTLEIRGMRANPIQAQNYTNFLFFSNDYDAMEIQAGDRRFNVAPRQEVKLALTPDDIDRITAELPAFAGFLNGYAADEQKARTAINNESKVRMREASQDALEQMCQAVLDGRLEYFVQFLADPDLTDLVAWTNYMSTVSAWMEQVGKPRIMRSQEIKHAYKYLMAPNQMPGPQKFNRMLAHKNLSSVVGRCPLSKEVTRGYRVEWKAEPEQVAEWSLLTTKAKQPPNELGTLQQWTQSQSA